MRKTSELALVGLMTSALFLISACGLFGGSNTPEEEIVDPVQVSAAETNSDDSAEENSESDSSETESNEQAAEDSSDSASSESANDESADASQSGEESQGESMITESGLEIVTIEEGAGDSPQSGDIVQVHYVGTLEDGTKFDSSRDRGEPIAFPLGRGAVIKGWDEGIALLKKGGKAKLIIPPDLGYGASGAGGVVKPMEAASFSLTSRVQLLV